MNNKANPKRLYEISDTDAALLSDALNQYEVDDDGEPTISSDSEFGQRIRNLMEMLQDERPAIEEAR